MTIKDGNCEHCKHWNLVGDGSTDRVCDFYGDCENMVVEQTNEEWFINLSTEEKADKLTDFSFWLVPSLPSEEKRKQVKEKILSWLKEKR